MYINLFVILKLCFQWHFRTIIDPFWKLSAQETNIFVNQTTGLKISLSVYIQDTFLKDICLQVTWHLYTWCPHLHPRPIWHHQIWSSGTITCRICKEYTAQDLIWKIVCIETGSNRELNNSDYTGYRLLVSVKLIGQQLSVLLYKLVQSQQDDLFSWN